METKASVRPLRRFVLLLDDQPEMDEGGVIVQRQSGVAHHDFPVVRVGEFEDVDFGQGDVAVLADPNAGRRIMLDGIVYRLVRGSDIIAVVEPSIKKENRNERNHRRKSEGRKAVGGRMSGAKDFKFVVRVNRVCKKCGKVKLMFRTQKACDECRGVKRSEDWYRK